MTFKEYQELHGFEWQRVGRAIVVVQRDRYHAGFYNLNDYFVSSVKMGSVWLLPKEKP